MVGGVIPLQRPTFVDENEEMRGHNGDDDIVGNSAVIISSNNNIDMVAIVVGRGCVG